MRLEGLNNNNRNHALPIILGPRIFNELYKILERRGLEHLILDWDGTKSSIQHLKRITMEAIDTGEMAIDKLIFER